MTEAKPANPNEKREAVESWLDKATSTPEGKAGVLAVGLMMLPTAFPVAFVALPILFGAAVVHSVRRSLRP